MNWVAPELIEEIDMNAEIGSYQKDDDREGQEPILRSEDSHLD